MSPDAALIPILPTIVPRAAPPADTAIRFHMGSGSLVGTAAGAGAAVGEGAVLVVAVEATLVVPVAVVAMGAAEVAVELWALGAGHDALVV